MKKIIWLLVLVLAIVTVPFAHVAAATTKVVFTVGSRDAIVNGQSRIMDVAPYIHDGRMFLPIRPVADAFGISDADVTYDAAAGKVTLVDGAKTVQMSIGSAFLVVNDVATIMDTAPEMKMERMFLPVKWIAQALGATATWNPAAQTVSLVVASTTVSPSVDSSGTALTSPADGNNLLLGNPSKAVHSTASPNNYLMTTSNYTLSYNKSRGEPNWVSWYLGPSSLGSTDRLNNFRADSTLPAGWYEVQANGYSGSGFDRGHNCPSADRTSSVAANSSTFLMTNMIPQAPRNNEGTWASFENYLRGLVKSGDELYIVMGSYGNGGTGSKGSATTIDGGHVTVPSHVWKVVVVLSNGTKDLSRITAKTRVIAINTPNVNSINSNWRTYVTSVDAIEKATGDDFLSNVPVAIQKVIEAKVDGH